MRRVINRISPAPGGATLQAAKLSGKTRQIQQFDTPRVQDGEKVDVQLRLRAIRSLVNNALFAESFRRPNAAIAVACDLRDTVQLQQLSQLSDGILRRKRRSNLSNGVQD